MRAFLDESTNPSTRALLMSQRAALTPLSRGATLGQEAREMSVLVGMPSSTVPPGRPPNASPGFSRWPASMPRLDLFREARDLGGYEGFVIAVPLARHSG